jgi:CheY-like chemotaxis protein/tetratricopeptide (TPR) repeat protein
MNLAQLLDRLSDPTLTPSKRAHLRCQLAKEREESGDYEGARRAMGDIWQRIGERPCLEGLDESAKAEVLLRVGVLTGWIGSAKQIEEAQETAKNLITESITIFEQLGDAEKINEAQTELAYCYWRQGAFDEARDILQEVSERLANTDSKIKPLALLRSGIVECSAKRFHDALRIFTEIAPLFGEETKHVLRGKYHNEFAIVLGILGTSERREDYTDRALVEYAAASYHFEQAGHFRYCACAENNLAMLYLTLGKCMEAHEHLDRALPLITRLKDSVHLAQIDETRAKVLLAEGRSGEAEKVISNAVRTLEKGDEQSLLAEALTTQGVALARTGRHIRARLTLQRAIVIAEQVGDKAAAGRAALTIIEELSDTSALAELSTLFEQAAEQLTLSQRGIAARLIEAARIVLRRFRPASPTENAGWFSVPSSWEGFSLRKEVRRYERFLIECALKDTSGVVTRAAQLLGFKHHYSLIDLINKRHKSLTAARSPVVQRKAVIGRVHQPRKRTRTATILHVEDNRMVADAVKETLETEGWKVVTCVDGETAWKLIESNVRYDLLLIDGELPDMNGIKLVSYARSIAHRQHTPIVMLSASDYALEAHRAGANAFLRKPEDTPTLVETIKRLLANT